MRNRLPIIAILIAFALAITVRDAYCQIPVDEAQRRLQEKLAARPAATQPVTEVERLREENRRLRERLSSLQEEVTTLKESLARAANTGGPATRPAPKEAAVDPKSPKALLPGRWHGGDAGAGAGYITVFDSDGTYKQTWLSYPKQDLGQYQFIDDNTLEMWGRTAPEDRRHNQYRITINGNQITLTPLVLDGADVKNGRAVVLKRAD
jgi:hypothetical protein